MKPLSLRELPSPAAFEELRPALREAIAAHKRARRIAVGPRVTLLFEDRETVRWQVLEMARVEGLQEPARIQHELDVYNELLPGPGELSATLFIEIPEAHAIRRELDRLLGLDEHVLLRIGEHEVRARFDERQLEADRISAVHYLRFPLPEPAREAWQREEVPISLEIDHPAYRATAKLGPDLRASLAHDLAGGCEELVPLGDRPRADRGDRDEVLLARGRVRVVRPARPRARGHLVVEPCEPAPAFADAPEDLLTELLSVAREQARGVEARYGRCRISLDATGATRFELFAPRGPDVPRPKPLSEDPPPSKDE